MNRSPAASSASTWTAVRQRTRHRLVVAAQRRLGAADRSIAGSVDATTTPRSTCRWWIGEQAVGRRIAPCSDESFDPSRPGVVGLPLPEAQRRGCRACHCGGPRDPDPWLADQLAAIASAWTPARAAQLMRRAPWRPDRRGDRRRWQDDMRSRSGSQRSDRFHRVLSALGRANCFRASATVASRPRRRGGGQSLELSRRDSLRRRRRGIGRRQHGRSSNRPATRCCRPI